jgi:hypothetical protein
MEQYRSLLVNGAAAATVQEGTPATVSQAGAGILDLLAAVKGTVAAYPTSLNFGAGEGALHSTVPVTLSNVGAGLDTFTLQAVAAGNAPAPVPAVDSVVLDAGASQQVAVTLDAAALAPGEYSGYVTVTGTASSTVAKIPYWFAVPGGDPVGISVLYQDYYDAARTSSTQAVVLRIVDAAGLPYGGALRPSITVAGSGSVRGFYRTGTIPGTYAVDIRTGTASMELSVTIGSVTETVVIPVY